MNEIISLDNLSVWLQARLVPRLVSCQLAFAGNWYLHLVYMALIDWNYCFGHQTATGVGGHRGSTAPTCTGHWW